jgi:hypothetical protein
MNPEPTFFRTITSSPQWQMLEIYQGRIAHQYDMSETLELGYISPEQWQDFLEYCYQMRKGLDKDKKV